MAAVLPADWHISNPDKAMEPPNSTRQQRSSPANDHSSPNPSQNIQQQQLLLAQQQNALVQSPYTFPAQQQQQGSWTPSINATPFYPSFYNPQLPQQPGQPFTGQLPPPSAYIDQANAQLAQWAYQQMMFNAQHGFPGMSPQHHSPSQRPGGALPSPTDYFAQSQMASPFNGFPSGTPPPNAHRGGAGDHQAQQPAPYPGFHPYRRPNRQQSHNTNTPDAGDWRSAPTINHPPHAPYMRPDASGSTSSVNSNGSQRQRTNSNQSGHSSHNVPPPQVPANRSRSNTGSSATSNSARNTPPPPPASGSPSPSQRSESSTIAMDPPLPPLRPRRLLRHAPRSSHRLQSTAAASPASTSPSPSPSTSSPAPRLTRPSPLSQGNFTASEKRMSRDDSDLAAMMQTQPSAIPSRSGGLKSRLKRALSFNPAQALKEESEMEQDDDASIKASALNGGASSSKLKGKSPTTPTGRDRSMSTADSTRSAPLPDDASSTATVQTKKKGRAASLFNARFNASTDNISLSSTVSSASVMIRKLGSLGNLARRNSLAGITSLFKDKDKDKEGGEESKGKKKKAKKGAKAEASEASVSHVTAELDRGGGDWTVGTDMNGLTPAAKLARQHTLKSNAEAAARAKEKAERVEKEREASAASDALAKANASRANGVNGAGVPTWDKNTSTRNGAVSPRSGSVKIAEDGTRVLQEDDEDESEDGHYGSAQGHQYYNAEGWEDDEDWDVEGQEPEEDVTIRQGLQRASLDENNDVEPWAVDIRRSVERARQPARGILKYAGTYDQSSYLNNHNAPQLRARSNSYDSPASQSELGPLAHIPSPDPDHIDGLHRHGSCSASGHEHTPESAPILPSLPPLTFDSSSSRISMSFLGGSKEAKDLKDLPDPPAAAAASNLTASASDTNNRASAIFQNPSFNSSAPVLSTIGASAPALPHRSATTPQKKLTFATSLAVYDTFSPAMYDRRSEPATWSRLTPALAQRIKEELNSYKMEEMEVHASSRIHTQFFV
ncbi:hypothetical protein DFP72DRAFT_884 [Ephemerocybe angulata]|uniref:Uncharacterized protein n=1 Tax=Ephemerocybe angulata TaxID=980116 RepID=A0A8H6IJY6_9AGAR|nr:hypothetical protein DFP72DRAFT_884 [Tulosesus angulatus]